MCGTRAFGRGRKKARTVEVKRYACVVVEASGLVDPKNNDSFYFLHCGFKIRTHRDLLSTWCVPGCGLDALHLGAHHHNNPTGTDSSFHFMDEGTEAQRGLVTCLKLNS